MRHRSRRPGKNPVWAIGGVILFCVVIVIGGAKLYTLIKVPREIRATVVFTREFVSVKNETGARWEETVAVLNGKYRYTNAMLWPGWTTHLQYTNFTYNGQPFSRLTEKPTQIFLQPRGSNGIRVSAPPE